MKCENCGSEMRLVLRNVSLKLVLYKCDECGHREEVKDEGK